MHTFVHIPAWFYVFAAAATVVTFLGGWLAHSGFAAKYGARAVLGLVIALFSGVSAVFAWTLIATLGGLG